MALYFIAHGGYETYSSEGTPLKATIPDGMTLHFAVNPGEVIPAGLLGVGLHAVAVRKNEPAGDTVKAGQEVDNLFLVAISDDELAAACAASTTARASAKVPASDIPIQTVGGTAVPKRTQLCVDKTGDCIQGRHTCGGALQTLAAEDEEIFLFVCRGDIDHIADAEYGDRLITESEDTGPEFWDSTAAEAANSIVNLATKDLTEFYKKYDELPYKSQAFFRTYHEVHAATALRAAGCQRVKGAFAMVRYMVSRPEEFSAIQKHFPDNLLYREFIEVCHVMNRGFPKSEKARCEWWFGLSEQDRADIIAIVDCWQERLGLFRALACWIKKKESLVTGVCFPNSEEARCEWWFGLSAQDRADIIAMVGYKEELHPVLACWIKKERSLVSEYKEIGAFGLLKHVAQGRETSELISVHPLLKGKVSAAYEFYIKFLEADLRLRLQMWDSVDNSAKHSLMVINSDISSWYEQYVEGTGRKWAAVSHWCSESIFVELTQVNKESLENLYRNVGDFDFCQDRQTPSICVISGRDKSDFQTYVLGNIVEKIEGFIGIDPENPEGILVRGDFDVNIATQVFMDLEKDIPLRFLNS
ncbi:hypothetical protein OTB20_39850 [Streptomyces sp. H27-H1]|uniref:putative adhesin n=1 Tax=Streptomyces sp. H27-H1 TaxID=2996461 RepID=UPI002270971B|nr:hypothetical protein [Streptomyces sp. H27-H1]MCY0932213.1 hypothetical protein [Streptomyces sp. H27-H1]